MKATILLAVLVMLFLVSCSSSDDDTIINPTLNIYGTWNSISFVANEPLFDINNDGVTSLELLDELPCRYSKLVLNEDLTFYQESNTWNYNEGTNDYGCTSGDISPVTGTWKVNSNFSLLSLDIDGNTAFLEIEFDGDTLRFNSSEVFIDRNSQGELQNIYGKVIYRKNGQ